jgi:hypothetical protein
MAELITLWVRKRCEMTQNINAIIPPISTDLLFNMRRHPLAAPLFTGVLEMRRGVPVASGFGVCGVNVMKAVGLLRLNAATHKHRQLLLLWNLQFWGIRV